MNSTRTNLIILCFLLLKSFVASGASFKVLHTSELSLLMKSSQKIIYIYDINVESTREKVGILPGAKLLSSSKNYIISSELPSDKNSMLIFYCANVECTASHTAAERAIHAGYKNVSVMVDGVYGWKKAGLPLESTSNLALPIEPKTVAAMMEHHSAIIVDVREAEERHEIISGAISMPISKTKDTKYWNEFTQSLSKNKTIIFYCAAGARSKKASERLRSEGFKAGYFYGPDQWKSAGLPLIQGPAN